MTATLDAPGVARSRRLHRRLRVVGLLGVLVMLAAALATGLRDDPAEAPAAAPDTAEVAALRAAADLGPCPEGLGPALPDLVLPCLDGGRPVDLRSAPPGVPTLVNVWASWCGPCVDEVPALQEFADRAGDRVSLVGVLTTDSLRSALTFADAYGMRYPSVVDDDGLVLRSVGGGPPVTLFLDAEGRLVHTERGAFDSADEIAGLVAQHLGVAL